MASERKRYHVDFWVEATEYSYDVMMTQDESSVLYTRLNQNEDITDLHVFVPLTLDGPDELLEREYWIVEAEEDKEDTDATD